MEVDDHTIIKNYALALIYHSKCSVQCKNFSIVCGSLTRVICILPIAFYVNSYIKHNFA